VKDFNLKTNIMNLMHQLFFIISLLIINFNAYANCNDFVPGQVLVKFKNNKSTYQKTSLRTQTNATVAKKFNSLNIELWEFSGNKKQTDILEFIETYKNHPDIEYIEPNYIFRISDFAFKKDESSTKNQKRNSQTEIPNDLLFKQQRYLNDTINSADINALAGWDITSISPSVIVAILDTGTDWKHPDLVNNIWQNSGEDLDGDGVLVYVNGNWIFDPDDENGIDDDGNGKIDDFIGWDFINNDNNPMDDEGHGTAVAGIIGAEGNNSIGVTGVSWDVQLASLKIFRQNNTTDCAAIVEAIDYSVQNNFPISNNSWGGPDNCERMSYSLSDAIENARNNEHLFIAAAGNSGTNNDEIIVYPASFDFDNIISVAAIDYNDQLLTTSNYGPTRVDIAAPGNLLRTTSINNSYGLFSQTSSAAPQISGACALLKYVYPDLSATQIKDIVLSTAKITNGLNNKVLSNGKLDLGAALASGSTPLCRVLDSLTLRKLYQTFNGTSWITQWNLNQPIDTWYGVSLNTNQCVSGLNLSSNNLSGLIPTDIGELISLKTINLSNNQLSDSIPSQFYNLLKLEAINLSSNQLNGFIKNEITQLTSLKSLILNNNQFIGTIPIHISRLSNLSTLRLNNNSLSGPVPAGLGNLPKLTDLRLQNNSLSGCYEPNLNSLCSQFSNSFISTGNNFGSSWNSFCSNNENVCSNCRTTDSLALIELYNATNGANWINKWNLNQSMDNWHGIMLNENGCVIEITLQNNNLNGTIPSQIGNLSRLGSLVVSGNSLLTGSIPTSIGNLNNLTDIFLFGNNLTGSIPNSISHLTNLRTLVIADNDFTNSNIPNSISNLTNLVWLNLSNNNLNGNIPSFIGSLNNLTQLYLNNNNFSGSIPPALSNLNNLHTIWLNNNNLIGDIPPEIGDLNSLQHLVLQVNQLSGSVPVELTGLSNLITLSIDNNELTGIIPPEIGNFSKLENLGLWNNQLTGSIPTQIGNLTNLKFLWLGDNFLSGIIPSSIGNLNALENLQLTNNQLSGSLPNELGKLSNLGFLSTSFNVDLEGGYATSFVNLCSQLDDNSDFAMNVFTNLPSWEDFCNSGTGTFDLVWPGDFNDDGTANIMDVLFWGLANGYTGPARPNATTLWIGQDAPVDWNFDVKAINSKKQDGDGNGIVNEADLQVLRNNFGETRISEVDFTLNNTNIFEFERIYGEGFLTYDLYVKNANGGSIETHGVALTLDLGDYNLTSVEVNTDNSCLAPQQVFEKIDISNNLFHLAVTRTNKTNVLCNDDPFARVNILIEDNVPTDTLILFRMEGHSIKSNETIEGIRPLSVIDEIPSNNLFDSSSVNFSLAITHADCNNLGSITVTPKTNNAAYTYCWDTGATTSYLNNLTPGIYEVTVTDEFDNSRTVSAEVQGQLIPQYDENGNLVNCNYGCPTLLNLNNNVQNGIYHAGAAISSKAQINSGNNVTFKAKDRIMLRNGFSVGTNTTFSATIEDCD